MLDKLREAFPHIDWKYADLLLEQMFRGVRGQTNEHLIEVSNLSYPGEPNTYAASLREGSSHQKGAFTLYGRATKSPDGAVRALQEKVDTYRKICAAFDTVFPEGVQGGSDHA